MSGGPITDLVLNWQFDDNDLRKAQLWMPAPEGSTEPLKLFYVSWHQCRRVIVLPGIAHRSPVQFSTYDRQSTYYRWNLMVSCSNCDALTTPALLTVH